MKALSHVSSNTDHHSTHHSSCTIVYNLAFFGRLQLKCNKQTSITHNMAFFWNTIDTIIR